MHQKYRIHQNVQIGKGCQISDCVEIGLTPGYKKKGELETVIGNNCVIRSGTIIYAGAKLGDGVKTGHYAIIREGNVVGNDCVIGSYTELAPGNEIGEGTKIHSFCFLEKTKIGNSVTIGPRVSFADDLIMSHKINESCVQGATVKDGVKIGMGSTILPHLTIGENSFIGAASVVTHDVEPNVVVVGNPAKFLKNIRDLENDPKGGIHHPHEI